jgi:DNA modification methylase
MESNEERLSSDEYRPEEPEEAAEDLGMLLPAEPDEVSDIGEVDADDWRKFPEVQTGSLWIFGSRSREGMHNGKYHGNFVPQIPFQAIRRFTKPGDVVLDPFLGSGTTLIESRRQGRNGIGVELIPSIAEEASTRIQAESNPYSTWQEVIKGDSTNDETIKKVRQLLERHGRNQVQLLVMHPPYHDIIHFSEDSRDLCNAPTLEDFLESFKKVVRGTYDLLENDHFLVVVIGDKYGDKKWVPLGFYTMEAVQSVGYTLKSIVVKNMEGNRAKRNLQNLWRQRAFRGKYYIFKHEYVLFFQKTEISENLRKVAEFVKAIDDREELGLIKDSSFVSGEELGSLATDYPWVSPSKLLALKHGQIRAVVLDLMGVNLTRDVENEHGGR